MSNLSRTGILIVAVSLAPFAVLCATDAIGWTGPSTGCGFVVLAVAGGGLGTLLWLVGLIIAPNDAGATRRR